jgi:excisionase family DNA binding protein
MEALLEGFTSIKVAATWAGVDESQIRRLLREGKVGGAKLGRDWAVNAASLDNYLATHGWHRARWRKRRMKE